MKNILTVDFEDWYQTESCRSRISFSEWDRMTSGLRENTVQLLDIFKKFNVKATFFILAYNLKRQPELIRMINSEGHELALHGYYHNLVYRQSPEQFSAEIGGAKKMLEDVIGSKISGFRAPGWSINESCLWAIDLLLQIGFHYDSSMDADVYRKCKDKIPCGIIEIPRSNSKFFMNSIPFGGGFFLRAYPYFLTSSLIKSKNKRKNPAVVYIHPWEINYRRPSVRLPFKGRIINNFSIKSAKFKLQKLLNDFEFGSIRDIFYGS